MQELQERIFSLHKSRWPRRAPRNPLIQANFFSTRVPPAYRWRLIATDSADGVYIFRFSARASLFMRIHAPATSAREHDDGRRRRAKITLGSLLQNITDDAVRELSERCPRLHYVCLSNCPNLTDASLVTLAQHCPLLSVLECVGCTHFTDAGFQALAKVS